MSLGLCPKCGAEGVLREKRMNGNDTCVNKHKYPSKDAVFVNPEGVAVSRLPTESIVFNPSIPEDIDRILSLYGPEGLYEIGKRLIEVADADMQGAFDDCDDYGNIRDMGDL